MKVDFFFKNENNAKRPECSAAEGRKGYGREPENGSQGGYPFKKSSVVIKCTKKGPGHTYKV